MSSDVNTKAPAEQEDITSNHGQLVFIAVGLAIVMGGLWLLYSADGPYHPAGEDQVQLSGD